MFYITFQRIIRIKWESVKNGGCVNEKNNK